MVIALKLKKLSDIYEYPILVKPANAIVRSKLKNSRYLDYCKQNAFSPIGTFTDVVHRYVVMIAKNIVAWLNLLMQGGADVVIVQFLDRFGRNHKEILRRIWELQDIGVSVVATDEDIREEIVLMVKAWSAGAESKKKFRKSEG